MAEYFEKYPTSYVLANNLLIAAILSTAYLGMKDLFAGVFSKVYVLVSLLFILVILRWAMCTNCYYYGKKCNTGWGILTAWLFKKGKKSEKVQKWLVLFHWVFWFAILPVLVMVYLSLTSFSYVRLVYLGIFIILQIISNKFRKVCCFHCYHKNNCPGSAYSKKK